jgi:hypothetical protein
MTQSPGRQAVGGYSEAMALKNMACEVVRNYGQFSEIPQDRQSSLVDEGTEDLCPF